MPSATVSQSSASLLCAYRKANLRQLLQVLLFSLMQLTLGKMHHMCTVGSPCTLRLPSRGMLQQQGNAQIVNTQHAVPGTLLSSPMISCRHFAAELPSQELKLVGLQLVAASALASPSRAPPEARQLLEEGL